MSSFKRFSFKEIREVANKTRVDHSKTDSIPVDIEYIIEHGFGMEIRPIKNLRSKTDIEAYVSKDLKSISIDARAYEEDRFQGRSRFTLAHELIDLAFSAGLWEEVIEERAKQYIGDKLSKKFNVSPKAIVTRIRREEIEVMKL